MSLARFLNRTLVILALVTASAYVTVGVLFGAPNVSNSVDGYLKQTFIENHRARFIEISESERPASEKTDRLIDLLADLEEVQKVDQLHGIKRAAFAQAAHMSIQDNRFDLAESLLESWLAFDPKDINASLTNCSLLMRTQQDQQKGENCVNELLVLFPHSLAVAQVASQIHFYNGQIGAAYLALEPFIYADAHPLNPVIGEVFQTHLIQDPQVPLHLSFEEGLPLVFSFTGSSSQLAVELVRISMVNGAYTKDLEHQGEIRINSLPKGESLQVTARIAEPPILTAILHPDARDFLLADLRARGEEDSINRLQQRAERG